MASQRSCIGFPFRAHQQMFGSKPAWLQEALENDKKAAAASPAKPAAGGKKQLTMAAAPLRIEYTTFYNDYKELLPGAEDAPEDLAKATQTLMEYCAKTWPSEIDISQVEYGDTKIFMNRELHGIIEIVRMKEEAKRLKAKQAGTS